MERIELSKNPIGYQIAISIGCLLYVGMLGVYFYTGLKDGRAALLVSLAFFIPLIKHIKTKKVVYLDNNLLVSSIRKKETIPVDNIKKVSIYGRDDKMQVEISFKEATTFGKSISYVPKKLIRIPTDKTVGIPLAPGITVTHY